ncbi:MAG: hypothetical protein M3Y81_10670 [Chloroflexota bacterium]|nr:hypothetical protein [Chloroflexota bacterium]
MFGKHLEPAEATVLYAEISSASSQASWQTYEFILDVRTASGQVFRATKKQDFVPFTHPKAGDVIKVKYNPKNMKVEFDLEGDLRYDTKARDAATKARHDAILASQPGTPLPQDPYQAALQGQLHSGTVEGRTASDLKEILSNALTNSAGQTFTTSGSQVQATQAQVAFMQSVVIRLTLQRTGATGIATILYLEDTGMSFPPFVAQKVTARVQEAADYQVFDCTFTAWVDTRKEQLYVGTSLPVRYDPTNHDLIIFHS